MLTPQSIKDQEFQTKFRGYDPIEVKAYLELLAEDFFELTEKNRVQAEEIESLLAEQESLIREKETLVTEVKISQENAEGIQSEIHDGYKHKDKEIDDITQELEATKASIVTLEQQNEEYKQKIAEMEKKLSGNQGASIQEQAAIEKLRGRIELLEEQNKELKQQGVDFKTTILTAQKFADNLRETSQQDAKKIMDEARAEIQRFRDEAEEELARLPEEIENLNQQKIKVRQDLKATIYAYLEALDSPDTSKTPVSIEKSDDISDLFQSIQIPDGDSVELDDIDNIKMDLS